MTSLIGQSLGRYHILEQLGEGGMAIVYKAFDTRLERDVAIKVILPGKEHSEKFLKRFDREAKALAGLSHPNIVKVIDYGEHEGLPYLVMEYLPGGTLKQKISGKPVPWGEAVQILIPVARALGYAHERKIIHRDVKSSNILITESGEPMLTDFGIAKLVAAEETQDLTGTGAGIGTPEYMSPEQAQGKPIDARSDLYSLGVVLYEMVTGRKPFQADTPYAVVIKQASEPLPRPSGFVPDLPDSLERILLKALAKLPENRYQDMQQFAEALRQLGLGSNSRPKTKVNFPKISRKVMAGVGIFGVAVAALLYVFQRGFHSSQQGIDPEITSTPEITSIPTISVGQNDVYDDFQDPQFDGNYDLNKWILDRGGGKIYQVNGKLVAHMDNTDDGGISLRALKYRNVPIEVPTYFEAKLRIDGPMDGHAFLFLGSNTTSGKFAFSDCTLGYGDVAGLLDCGYVDDGTTTLYRSDDTLENYGTWHTVRIEVDPGTMTFSYFVDGQKLESFTPPDAEQLKTAKFTMEIGLVAGNAGTWTAYIDDIKVGPISHETSSSPVSPTVAQETPSEGSYLALEDFEDEEIQIYGFDVNSDRWSIVDDGTGNKVYQVDNRDGTGTPSFSYGADEWDNYAVKYKIKYLSKEYVGLQVRSDGRNSYIVNMGKDDFYLAYSTQAEWVRIGSKVPPIQLDKWYTVKIELYKDSITVYLDNNKWFDERDSKYSRGWLLMFGEAGAYAQVDDIEVMELK